MITPIGLKSVGVIFMPILRERRRPNGIKNSSVPYRTGKQVSAPSMQLLRSWQLYSFR